MLSEDRVRTGRIVPRSRAAGGRSATAGIPARLRLLRSPGREVGHMSTSNYLPPYTADERGDADRADQHEVTYADFLGDQVDDDEVDAG